MDRMTVTVQVAPREIQPFGAEPPAELFALLCRALRFITAALCGGIAKHMRRRA